jgi:rubrerythrin
MELKGSKTEKNLMAAFAGESQARNRYTYYASIAKKEGYEQIAAIFLETAENEKEHAKLFFKHIPEGDVVITASYPKALGKTADNLHAAAEGEKMEWTAIYKDFAGIADKEGFADVAKTFRGISLVEKEHEKRYRDLCDAVKNKTLFKKENKIRWKCRNCGHVLESANAPDTCPVCNHPQAYYEVWHSAL